MSIQSMTPSVSIKFSSNFKQAFTLRRFNFDDSDLYLDIDQVPKAGDIVIARVTEIGQHTGVQLAKGFRSSLFLGDYLALAFADRYAPDQFEAYVPSHLNSCHLVAAGGVASEVVNSHVKMDDPTQLEPLGLLVDEKGKVVNMKDVALPTITSFNKTAKVFISVGTAMNAGKTTTAANLINGLSNHGYKVAAAKLTGTGAPGDVNLFRAAGAQLVYDFSDMGYATTFNQSVDELLDSSLSLIAHLEQSNPDVIVLEIADGLLQSETAELLTKPEFRSVVDGIIFSAGDAMGALHGVDWLTRHDLPVVAVSGRLTASPLAKVETEKHTRFPVMDAEAFAQANTIKYLMSSIVKQSSQHNNIMTSITSSLHSQNSNTEEVRYASA